MADHQHAHQGLLIAEGTVGAATVLSAAGTIDMVTAPQFQTHVDTVLARRPAALIIDLTHVEFLGSAGIGVLVSAHNNAGDIAYAVAADGPATSRPLHPLGIDELLRVYLTVADAMSGLGIAARETG